MMQNLLLLIHDSFLSREHTFLSRRAIRTDRFLGCHAAKFHVGLLLVLLVLLSAPYDFYAEPGYEVNKQSGAVNLVSEGYERTDIGATDKRSITGGTGPFKRARDEVNQALLGFNASGGVNLRFVALL